MIAMNPSASTAWKIHTERWVDRSAASDIPAASIVWPSA